MITEGYLARHYQGRSGGRDVALLDVAQDYAIKVLSDAGVFDLGLTLKGGTALRKYKVGQGGRFSTDLDFAANEAGLGELVLSTLDGAALHGVQFSIEVVTPGRRGRLRIVTPLGNPNVDALVEIQDRRPWLTPERLNPVRLPVHSKYEFEPSTIPVMAFVEILAEKLAAFRRRALARDLYDLALFSEGAFDQGVVRKLAYLKIFIDVVSDGYGSGPFDPSEDILRPRSASDFQAEDIGLLTTPVDIPGWLERVRNRFQFLVETTADERRWSECNHRDLADVRQIIDSLPVSS